MHSCLWQYLMHFVRQTSAHFTLLARNPANNVPIGGRHAVFAPVYGPPFVADREMLKNYEAPPLDETIAEELNDYVARRRAGPRYGPAKPRRERRD